MHEPDFASIRHEPKRLAQLGQIGAHNGRTMRVPNARPTKSDNPGRSKVKGANLTEAVNRIIAESGARPLYKGQNICIEVVATLKRNSGLPMPTEAEFTSTFDEYLDETHGERRVAARYVHADETSLHGHAVIVPVTVGRNRGRQPKNAKPKATVISCNIYMGSEGRRHCGRNHFRNPIMSAWQSGWAAKWARLGFRRGIESKREHTPIKRFQGQAATIMGMAEESLNSAVGSIKLPEFSAKDMARLVTKAGRAEAEARIRDGVRENVEKFVTYLRELAVRGLQVDLERSSRVDLEKRAHASEAKAAKCEKAAAAAQAELRVVAAKLQASEERLEAHESSHKSGDWLHSLSKDELKALMMQAESEIEERDVPQRRGMRALSVPTVPHGHSAPIHEPSR